MDGFIKEAIETLRKTVYCFTTKEEESLSSKHEKAFSVFNSEFPGEDEESLETNGRKIATDFILANYAPYSFEEVIVDVMNEISGVKNRYNLYNSSLAKLWDEFLENEVPGAKILKEEYRMFQDWPYAWKEVLTVLVTYTEQYNEAAKKFILAAIGKLKAFKAMVDKMELFYIDDKEVYIYTIPNLPYHLAKPEETGAEYCIIVHDDFYAVKRIDGNNFVPNPDWIYPQREMDKILKPLDIDKVDILEQYKELLNITVFGEMEIVGLNEVHVASFSEAVRLIQNLMV